MITDNLQACLIIGLHTTKIMVIYLLNRLSLNRPVWIQVLLVLEPAIEYPLMFLFHPTSMAYNFHFSDPLPTTIHLFSQTAAFFAVEMVLQNCVFYFIEIFPQPDFTNGNADHSPSCSKRQKSQHDEAERLVVDFIRPRATLLLTIFVLGIPINLTGGMWRLHPLAMVFWIALEQNFFGTAEAEVIPYAKKIYF